MKEPKQIAYFYDAILADEETELDLDGTVAVPVKGEVRQHGGKTWRVQHVTTERAGGPGDSCLLRVLKGSRKLR